MQIITALSPVLITIFVGFWLRRKNFLSEETVSGITSLVYWVGFPSLLFYKISTAQFDLGACGRIYMVMLSALVISILCAYGLAAIRRIPPQTVSSVIQGAFRANLAFVGLSVIMYSFSNRPSQEYESIQATAVFILAVMVLTNNVAAVSIFLLHQHTFSLRSLGKIAKEMITNPLLLASAAGLIAGHFIDGLPLILDRTLKGFSQMVLPLALLSVGATMAGRKNTQYFPTALLTSIIKVGICPLAGLLIGRYLIVLSPDHLRMAMIFMACPAAAASYVLAKNMGGDHQLTAVIIVLSTLLSTISLSLVVGLL